MKKKTHPNLGICSSLGLALAMAFCATVQVQSAEPAVEKNTMQDKKAESGQANKDQKLTKKGVTMKGYVQNIESLTVKNSDFRRVLYTAENCQLVLMALKPKEEIGAEVHKMDQFFRIEQGTGEAVLDGVRSPISAGFAVVVPAGTNHNIINTGTDSLKLYTIYSPPNHRDGVVHHTRAEAEADNEHFDGKTSK